MMASGERKRKNEDNAVKGESSSSSEESSVSSSSDSDHKKRKQKHQHSREGKKRKRSPHSRDEIGSRSTKAEPRSKKKRRDEGSVSSSSSYSSSDRRKKKERRRQKDKKRKRAKKEKRKRRETVEADDDKPYFGKYGILRASDYHKKSRSFTVWLEEVKGITDAPKYELQNHFKEFMEDFNTATLPHKKYYDYDRWELEDWESNKAASTGCQISSARRDEALHMQILQEKAREKQKQELDLLKSSMNKDKRDEMKRKAELQAEMAHAYKTGDQETYIKIKNRLEPER